MQVPHSQRSQLVAVDVPVRLHSAFIPENTRLLVRLVSLVVSVEGNRNYLLTIVDFADKDSATVTDVGAENFSANN